MTEEFVIGFTRQAIELTLSVALPMLGVGLDSDQQGKQGQRIPTEYVLH